jgi:hypothetical protein
VEGRGSGSEGPKAYGKIEFVLVFVGLNPVLVTEGSILRHLEVTSLVIKGGGAWLQITESQEWEANCYAAALLSWKKQCSGDIFWSCLWWSQMMCLADN